MSEEILRAELFGVLDERRICARPGEGPRLQALSPYDSDAICQWLKTPATLASKTLFTIVPSTEVLVL